MICGIYTEQQPVTWAENAADKGGFYEMGACVDHGAGPLHPPGWGRVYYPVHGYECGGTANRHWGAAQGKDAVHTGRVVVK